MPSGQTTVLLLLHGIGLNLQLVAFINLVAAMSKLHPGTFLRFAQFFFLADMFR